MAGLLLCTFHFVEGANVSTCGLVCLLADFIWIWVCLFVCLLTGRQAGRLACVYFHSCWWFWCGAMWCYCSLSTFWMIGLTLFVCFLSFFDFFFFVLLSSSFAFCIQLNVCARKRIFVKEKNRERTFFCAYSIQGYLL